MDEVHLTALNDVGIQPVLDPDTGCLQRLRITACHPVYGPGTVDLTPAQLACLPERLAQIGYATAHRLPVTLVGSCRLPTGADAVLVTDPGDDASARSAVAIQRGTTAVVLTPEQVEPTRRALAWLAATMSVAAMQEGGEHATDTDGAGPPGPPAAGADG